MHAKTRLGFTNYSPFLRWSNRYKKWVAAVEWVILIAWWLYPTIWIGFAVAVFYDAVWAIYFLVETWRHHRHGDLRYK